MPKCRAMMPHIGRHGIRYGHRAFIYSFPTANITLNMKRTFFILTAFFALLSSSIPSLAYDCCIDGIYYNLYTFNKTASVTKGNNNKGDYIGDVVIPNAVKYYNTTYSVTSIGHEAFSDCSGLTSVTIPNSVTYIGNGPFGTSAFYGCSGLTSVTVDKNNGTYDSRDNCNAIIETSTNKLIAGCKNTTIPNSVTSIGEYAFLGCSGLTSVTIPNSVTSISKNAFAACFGLTSVTIPNSVTSIGHEAFYRCSGLTSVTIPNSVSYIGEAAFKRCSGLTSVTVDKNNGTYDSRDNCNAIIETSTNKLIVGCKNTTIPNSVTSIGDGAFGGCSGLTSVTIPNSVTSIGDGAFYDCYRLTSVTIPNSVTSIGDRAFYNCSGLTSVTVDKNNGTYDSRDNCNAIIETSTNKLIVGCNNTIIPNSVTSIGYSAFYGCSGLTSVIIPNSVTSIGDYAFYRCSGLTSVTIGNSVTTIGIRAFSDCSRLTKLVALSVEPPTCGIIAFSNVDKTTCQLLVPEESINKYKTADQWKDFLNISGYDGVDDVSVDSQNAVYEVYNLQGVRIGSGMREAEVTADALPHGVYILVSPQGRKKIQI